MKITVIGLGHLGVVTAGGLAMAGHQVTGVDVDNRTINRLRSGQVPFYEPGLGEWVAAGLDRGNVKFFHRDEFPGYLGQVALIATGTPATENGGADLAQVRSALAWIKEHPPPGPGAGYEEHSAPRYWLGCPATGSWPTRCDWLCSY